MDVRRKANSGLRLCVSNFNIVLLIQYANFHAEIMKLRTHCIYSTQLAPCTIVLLSQSFLMKSICFAFLGKRSKLYAIRAALQLHAASPTSTEIVSTESDKTSNFNIV